MSVKRSHPKSKVGRVRGRFYSSCRPSRRTLSTAVALCGICTVVTSDVRGSQLPLAEDRGSAFEGGYVNCAFIVQITDYTSQVHSICESLDLTVSRRARSRSSPYTQRLSLCTICGGGLRCPCSEMGEFNCLSPKRAGLGLAASVGVEA